MRKRIPIEQQRRMADDYAKGMTARKVAEKYGVAMPTVLNACKRCGVDRRAKTYNRGLTPEQVADVRRLLAEGKPRSGIAAKHGTTYGVVKKIATGQSYKGIGDA